MKRGFLADRVGGKQGAAKTHQITVLEII